MAVKETYKASELDELIKLIEQCLMEGAKPPHAHGPGRSVIEVVTEKLRQNGITYGHAGVRRRIEAAIVKGKVIDWALYRPVQYVKPAPVRKLYPVRVEGPEATGIKGFTGERFTSVAVIPDIHIAPGISNERMHWIGRWVNDIEPDYIVQLGDWLTLDSMSTHAAPGSIAQLQAPTFQADLAAGRESIEIFNDAVGDKGITKRIETLGNHEFRAYRFENLNSCLEGTLIQEIEEMFAAGGFRPVPFGQFAFIEGVGFIHHANNTLGRPYGGKTVAQRIAAESIFSVVHGHCHTKQAADAPKIGPSHSVRAISAGCALPYGHVEEYAQHATTGWWWGVLNLVIHNGIILDEHWTSMISLERRYGRRRHLRRNSQSSV